MNLPIFWQLLYLLIINLDIWIRECWMMSPEEVQPLLYMCQGSHPFQTSFPPCEPFPDSLFGHMHTQTHTHNLGFPVSSTTLVLAFISIGLEVITPDLSYLPSPNPFLSYLFLYPITPFFYLQSGQWSHLQLQVIAYLYLLLCLPQVNMVHVLVCVPTVQVYIVEYLLMYLLDLISQILLHSTPLFSSSLPSVAANPRVPQVKWAVNGVSWQGVVQA